MAALTVVVKAVAGAAAVAPLPPARPKARAGAGLRRVSPLPPRPSPEARLAAPPAALPAVPLTSPLTAAGAGDAVALAEAEPPPAAAVVAREALSAEGLREYRLALAGGARPYKRYPALARERGWEGTAEVLVSVGGPLPAPWVSLARSSGHAALDAQALAMVGQAARQVAIPSSLAGRAFDVLLPVRFSLEEGR